VGEEVDDLMVKSYRSQVVSCQRIPWLHFKDPHIDRYGVVASSITRSSQAITSILGAMFFK
jgi:hypothetical protein